MITLADVVRLNAKHLPNDEAVVQDDVRLTWRELDDQVNRVASGLLASGVAPGDRIAVLAKISIPYICMYFAAAKVGAIVVPLNFWHRPDEHDYVVGDSTPALLFHESEYAQTLAQVGSADGLARVELPTGPASSTESWDRFLATGVHAGKPEVALEPSMPHMIMYTAGTTGRPKGAVLTSTRTIPGNLAMSLGLGLRQDDAFLNHFPTFHASCWDHMMLFMLVGARTVVLRQYDPGSILDLVEREKVTVLLGLPTMLLQLLEHPRSSQADVSSIRLLYYGAYDPSGVLDRTAEYFGAREGRIEMAHTYGLTESAPFVTLCPPQDVFSHWGSIGRPLPGLEVELRDAEGNAVPPGVPGELCIKGPHMAGYWNNPDATNAAVVDGWLSSGDVAVADEDGFMRIVDRTKDVVRSGGHNVFSKQIEDCLALHEGVADVAVIGIPDPVWEEAIWAVVVPSDDLPTDDASREQLRESLRAHVKQRLAGYNTPRHIEFVTALPKNAVGKTQKHVLRERFGSVFAQPDDRASADQR